MSPQLRKEKSLEFATRTWLKKLKEIRGLYIDNFDDISIGLKGKILKLINEAEINNPEKRIQEELNLAVNEVYDLVYTMSERLGDFITLVTDIDGMEIPIKSPLEVINKAKLEEELLSKLGEKLRDFSKAILAHASMIETKNESERERARYFQAVEIMNNMLNGLLDIFSSYQEAVWNTEEVVNALFDELREGQKWAKELGEKHIA